MLGFVFAALYFFAYLALGQLASHTLFAKESLLIRLWLGGVIALALLLWLPALFSFFFGFTLLSNLLALTFCVLSGAFCALKLRKLKNLMPQHPLLNSNLLLCFYRFTRLCCIFYLRIRSP